MSRTRLNSPAGLLSVAVGAALFALTGCNGADAERTLGERVDSALATAARSAETARVDIRQEVTDARQDATRATAGIKERAAAAAETVADKLQDATITAAVNAELAKDARLSVRRIDVDTVAGRVMLRGTAPDIAARARAGRLASSVQGVTGVDNRLDVPKLIRTPCKHHDALSLLQLQQHRLLREHPLRRMRLDRSAMCLPSAAWSRSTHRLSKPRQR